MSETRFLLAQGCLRLKGHFFLQQDAVKAAKLLQDNKWPWRSWASIGHVLLISLFYGNLFQQRKGEIQHDPLLFTTPLTMWQGLYSSLFYAKKKWKILDCIWFEDTDGFELPGFNLAVTSVQGGKIVKITIYSFSDDMFVLNKKYCSACLMWLLSYNHELHKGSRMGDPRDLHVGYYI